MKSKSDHYRDLNEKLKLRANVWPHQFLRDGSAIQNDQGNWLQPMICKHCMKRFTQGRDSQPTEPCPARNDKREMGKLLR